MAFVKGYLLGRLTDKLSTQFWLCTKTGFVYTTDPRGWSSMKLVREWHKALTYSEKTRRWYDDDYYWRNLSDALHDGLRADEKEHGVMRTAQQVIEDAARSGSSLEDRKNGKLKMELVDDGFPFLNRELGRMMTWAAAEKGYLPHDWKKMPAEQFLAAAARHRNKRQCGEQYDEESGLLHLVHESFNIQAACEVALMAREKQ